MSNTATLLLTLSAAKRRVPAALIAMPTGRVAVVGNGEPGTVVKVPSSLISKAAILLVTGLVA